MPCIAYRLPPTAYRLPQIHEGGSRDVASRDSCGPFTIIRQLDRDEQLSARPRPPPPTRPRRPLTLARGPTVIIHTVIVAGPGHGARTEGVDGLRVPTTLYAQLRVLPPSLRDIALLFLVIVDSEGSHMSCQ